MAKTLNEWARDIHQNAVEHGWWDEPRSFGDGGLPHPHPRLVRQGRRGCGGGAGAEARVQPHAPVPPRRESTVKIGDRVQRVPETFGETEEIRDRNRKRKARRRAYDGTVIYIHPLGRFHVVAFETRGGTIRESFAGV